MSKKFVSWLAVVLAMLSISGCASPNYEGMYPWADGWREGKVNRLIQGGDAVRKFESACSDVRADPTDRFAVVEWRQQNRPRWFTVKLDMSANVNAGDEVYVNVLNCREPVVSRRVIQNKLSSD